MEQTPNVNSTGKNTYIILRQNCVGNRDTAACKSKLGLMTQEVTSGLMILEIKPTIRRKITGEARAIFLLYLCCVSHKYLHRVNWQFEDK